MVGEPRLVVVETDVAAVDRRRAVLRVEDERRVDVRERGRLVWLEDVALERAGEEVVVDAEEHVALADSPP